MRQKEVMGQSIRTSKSARPGTITYVPIDKSEFRATVSSDKKKNKIMKIVVMLIVMIWVMSCCVYAGISYYYSYQLKIYYIHLKALKRYNSAFRYLIESKLSFHCHPFLHLSFHYI